MAIYVLCHHMEFKKGWLVGSRNPTYSKPREWRDKELPVSDEEKQLFWSGCTLFTRLCPACTQVEIGLSQSYSTTYTKYSFLYYFCPWPILMTPSFIQYHHFGNWPVLTVCSQLLLVYFAFFLGCTVYRTMHDLQWWLVIFSCRDTLAFLTLLTRGTIELLIYTMHIQSPKPFLCVTFVSLSLLPNNSSGGKT